MVNLQHDKKGSRGCLDGHSVWLVWKLMLCNGKRDIAGSGGIYPSDVHRYLSKTCPSFTTSDGHGMEKNNKTEAILKSCGSGRLKS